MWHDPPNVQLVSFAGGYCLPRSHGADGEQMLTLVNGAFAVGGKVGRGSSPLVAVGLGDGDGLADAFGVGEAFAVPPDPVPRPCKRIRPTVPISRMAMIAMTAGIIQDGRSIGPRFAGRGGTVDGLRAGARIGVGGTVAGAGAELGGAAGGVVDKEDREDEGVTSAPAGVHTGGATGSQVCCCGWGALVSGGGEGLGATGAGVHVSGPDGAGAEGGVGAGAAGAGGFVALVPPGGMVSKGDAGAAGDDGATGSHRAGPGGGSYGVEAGAAGGGGAAAGGAPDGEKAAGGGLVSIGDRGGS